MMVTLVTVLCSEGGPIILIFIIRVINTFLGVDTSHKGDNRLILSILSIRILRHRHITH